MEKNTQAETELITVLPIWTVRMTDGRETRSPVRLYRSYGNPCEHRGDRDRCDESGSYYGSEQGNPAGVIKLCPRHWYGIHFDPHPVSVLLDMTDEEHEEELGKLIREKREATNRVAKGAPRTRRHTGPGGLRG